MGRTAFCQTARARVSTGLCTNPFTSHACSNFHFCRRHYTDQKKNACKVQALQNAIKIAILVFRRFSLAHASTVTHAMRSRCTISIPESLFLRRRRACCRAMRFALVRVSERLGFALHALVPGACADRSANPAKNLQNHITVETMGRTAFCQTARAHVSRSPVQIRSQATRAQIFTSAGAITRTKKKTRARCKHCKTPLK